jgi:hypothetical protein
MLLSFLFGSFFFLFAFFFFFLSSLDVFGMGGGGGVIITNRPDVNTNHACLKWTTSSYTIYLFINILNDFKQEGSVVDTPHHPAPIFFSLGHLYLCGSKNIYQKDMCLKDIGYHVQNKMTILDMIAYMTIK